MRYIVSDKGPIDRHLPGTDVTGVYTELVTRRLLKEGYLRQEDDTQPVVRRVPKPQPAELTVDGG